MTDVHDKDTRSFNMSRIKGKNTKPEILVRRFLFGNGFRYRLYSNKLPGKPDIVLPKYHTVIFVHGCFWHGHENCKQYKIPSSNTLFWNAKINYNRIRDERVRNELMTKGWKVITVWNCEFSKKNYSRLESLLNELKQSK